MPDQLTPARLREMIAAATKHGIKAYPEDTPYTFLDWSGPGGRLRKVDADLIVFLVNNAPALADDCDKARLLEWLCENTARWNVVFRAWDGQSDFIDAIRAAKEAAQST